MKKKILQRESWRMTFSCINRRETDLTTFHFKTQRKAKQKKKKKRERELALLSHTAPQRPLLQTSPVFPLSFASSISPFIPISSLPSAFVYSFGHGASYLKIVFSSLFLDFLAVDFIYWDTFFFVSLRVFVWPLNCHLAASIVDSQPCYEIVMFNGVSMNTSLLLRQLRETVYPDPKCKILRETYERDAFWLCH